MNETIKNKENNELEKNDKKDEILEKLKTNNWVKKWFEEWWYNFNNIWLEKIWDNRYLFYEEWTEHPIRIVSWDLEYQSHIDIREWMSEDILKRRYKYPAMIAWYKLEYEEWELSIYKHNMKRKEDKDWNLTTKLEWEKWRKIDIFSEEFAKARDKIDFLSKKLSLELATDLEYKDINFYNKRWIAKIRDIIRYKDLIPEEKYEKELKRAKENLLEQVWDERYNYLHDEVTKQELDTYLKWWIIEYPRWVETKIPSWSISKELYEKTIKELEELEKARREKIKEEEQEREKIKNMLKWIM